MRSAEKRAYRGGSVADRASSLGLVKVVIEENFDEGGIDSKGESEWI